MIENKFITGGETSGHILMLKYSSTGDSIVAALQFLYYSDILNQKNIKNYLDKYPQKITNLFVEKNVSNNIINIAIKEAHDKYESSKLRLIIRKSGTENCIRIMVEAKDKIFVDNISKEIEIFIARKLKSLL
jgi:phosphoglucosamine mutase